MTAREPQANCSQPEAPAASRTGSLSACDRASHPVSRAAANLFQTNDIAQPKEALMTRIAARFASITFAALIVVATLAPFVQGAARITTIA